MKSVVYQVFDRVRREIHGQALHNYRILWYQRYWEYNVLAQTRGQVSAVRAQVFSQVLEAVKDQGAPE
jgi:hypothetical protein